MPYRNDPRRTVTLNLQPDEYAALAEDALEAGYATPGTYAKALVLARGEAPAPILDERTEERVGHLQGSNIWLLQQYDTLVAQLREAGVTPRLAKGPLGRTPRSRASQNRAIRLAVDQAVELAVEEAVEETLRDERARVARRQQQRRDARAAQQAGTPPPAAPAAADSEPT